MVLVFSLNNLEWFWRKWFWWHCHLESCINIMITPVIHFHLKSIINIMISLEINHQWLVADVMSETKSLCEWHLWDDKNDEIGHFKSLHHNFILSSTLKSEYDTNFWKKLLFCQIFGDFLKFPNFENSLEVLVIFLAIVLS